MARASTPAMEQSNILPFRGRKPVLIPGDHPLPWRYEGGFIRDAKGRLVGSTVEPEMAEWIVRSVNATAE